MVIALMVFVVPELVGYLPIAAVHSAADPWPDRRQRFFRDYGGWLLLGWWRWC